tara:strand:+ start:485 stop:868 length:384 start_codon:yes stop_codon:yes gene_type:complete
MNEILGATGSTSPINPIRKKELDDKWKEIVTKAITDKEFKKKLVANPIKVIKDQGLEASDGIKISFDEVTKVHKVGVNNDSNEEITAEGKWWSIRLKMIKEFGVELNRQVGNVVGFDEGAKARSIIN